MARPVTSPVPDVGLPRATRPPAFAPFLPSATSRRSPAGRARRPSPAALSPAVPAVRRGGAGRSARASRAITVGRTPLGNALRMGETQFRPSSRPTGRIAYGDGVQSRARRRFAPAKPHPPGSSSAIRPRGGRRMSADGGGGVSVAARATPPLSTPRRCRGVLLRPAAPRSRPPRCRRAGSRPGSPLAPRPSCARRCGTGSRCGAPA